MDRSPSVSAGCPLLTLLRGKIESCHEGAYQTGAPTAPQACDSWCQKNRTEGIPEQWKLTKFLLRDQLRNMSLSGLDQGSFRGHGNFIALRAEFQRKIQCLDFADLHRNVLLDRGLKNGNGKTDCVLSGGESGEPEIALFCSGSLPKGSGREVLQRYFAQPRLANASEVSVESRAGTSKVLGCRTKCPDPLHQTNRLIRRLPDTRWLFFRHTGSCPLGPSATCLRAFPADDRFMRLRDEHR